VKIFSYFCLALVLSLSLSGCGVKVSEEDASAVMQKIYKARKKGNIASELRHYAKDDFKIVPFAEVESSLYTILGRAGRLKSIKPLNVKSQRRNQLGEGLVTYLVFTYEVTYSNMTLLETYYFLGSSEKPKLVYMTLQL
jgi:hypothetical protein